MRIKQKGSPSRASLKKTHVTQTTRDTNLLTCYRPRVIPGAARRRQHPDGPGLLKPGRAHSVHRSLEVRAAAV
jgi:hypothetical protein